MLVLLEWLALAFAVAWLFLRHAPFALLVAVSPLPGVFFASWLIDRSDPSQYTFGFCCSLLMAGALMRRDLFAGGDWRTVAWAAAGAAITAIGLYRPPAHNFAVEDLLRWRPVVLLLFSALSAAGFVTAGRRFLSFGEDFIARANRTAETRARTLEVAAQIATPRWALALCGIAMVMAALAWFDISPRAAFRPGFVLAVVAAFVLARDWRAAVAAAASVALLWLFRADAALPFLILPLLLLAGASRGREERGPQAWQRTLEEEGAGLLFAALGGTALLALAAPDATWLAAMEAFIASLIFYPAITVALWSIFPPYRSIEELYRG
ncbi:MAG TPA: hypothetical protein VHV26_04440 [Rhizomicrobium sp.]|nr:hypothetical protein [Rhizomicrobium sp.]